MKKIILMITIGICIVSVSAWASFMDLGSGARPSAMGKAYAGISDDLEALYYNNAGLYQLNKIGFISTYSRLYADIAGLYEVSFGLAVPISEEYGTFGLKWYSLNLNGQSDGVSYYEHTIGIAYGYPVHKLLKLDKHEISIGMGVKLLGKIYGINEWVTANPIFIKTNAWGLGIDMSFMYKPIFFLKNLSIGCSFENINQPNINIEAEDKIPFIMRTGISYLLLDIALISTEITYRNTELRYNAGLEYNPIKELSIRGGGSFGANNYTNVSMGFGYRFGLLNKNLLINSGELSYSFILPFNFVDTTAGTHRISLSLFF